MSNEQCRCVLTNYQSPGDILMLTAAVRDLHAAYPNRFVTDLRTSCGDIWHNNPYVTRFPEPWIEEEAARCRDARPCISYVKEGIRFIPCQYGDSVNRSNQDCDHFIRGYHNQLEDILKRPIPLTEFKPDLHLSDAERGWINQVQETGIREPYWIIAPGGKWCFTSKWIRPETMQGVVDALRGRVLFVQVGDFGNFNPQLANAVNLVGCTDLRMLIRLVYHAEGVLTGLNGIMHIAAGTPPKPSGPQRKPCVVIAGGREPTQWEAYPTHRYLSTQGALSCCTPYACWDARCTLVGDGDEKDTKEKTCQNYAAHPMPERAGWLDAQHVATLEQLRKAYLERCMADWREKAKKTQDGSERQRYQTLVDSVSSGRTLSGPNMRELRIARCIDMISTAEIVAAIESYYKGGILTWQTK